MAAGVAAIFITSRPETVVARNGTGFNGDRDVPDKSQWQCEDPQQSMGCDSPLWHWAVAGSHHSARVWMLPTSEIASSTVTHLKTARI
jgi:hypothetical protein